LGNAGKNPNLTEIFIPVACDFKTRLAACTMSGSEILLNQNDEPLQKPEFMQCCVTDS
jgi:homoserine O-acetyltransferase